MGAPGASFCGEGLEESARRGVEHVRRPRVRRARVITKRPNDHERTRTRRIRTTHWEVSASASERLEILEDAAERHCSDPLRKRIRFCPGVYDVD